MKKIVFIFCLILSASFVNAQQITDADRRDFNDLSPIMIDLDGDNKPDTIKPRIYQIKPTGGKNPKLSEVKNWIAFDLTTSRGRTIKNIFKYNYGTAEQGGSYWVYALKSAGDFNNDGETDLVFYSGDDTTEETIFLTNKAGVFSVNKEKSSFKELDQN